MQCSKFVLKSVYILLRFLLTKISLAQLTKINGNMWGQKTRAPEPRGQLPLLPFANGGSGGSIALSRKVELFITGNNLCDVKTESI